MNPNIRSARSTTTLLGAAALCLYLPAAGMAAGEPPPVPVSPGSTEGIIAVGSDCPTFSWTYSPGADAVDLAVYRLDPFESPAAPEEAAAVLEQRLPAGAVSWTPSAERCLGTGGSYAWFVRTETGGVSEGWSEGALFEIVSPVPSADAPVAAGGAHDDPTVAAPEPVSSAPNPAGPAPAPRAAVPATSGSGTKVTRPKVADSFKASGNVVIGGAYKYDEPRLVKHLIPAAAFDLQHNKEGDGWHRRNGYGFMPTVSGASGDVGLTVALLDLPHGARIVGFRCFVLDDVELTEAPGEEDLDDLQLIMALEHRLRLSAKDDRIATVFDQTDGVSSLLQTFDAGIFNPVLVDRDTFDYWIEGSYNPESQGESLRFYGCELDLEVKAVDSR